MEKGGGEELNATVLSSRTLCFVLKVIGMQILG